MNRTLAVECIISIGIVSWAPIKQRQLPWPPSIMYVAVAYSLLGLVSLVDEKMANLLAFGFLLAQLVGAMSKSPKLPDFIYTNLMKDGWFEAFSVGFDGKVGATS